MFLWKRVSLVDLMERSKGRMYWVGSKKSTDHHHMLWGKLLCGAYLHETASLLHLLCSAQCLLGSCFWLNPTSFCRTIQRPGADGILRDAYLQAR